MTATERARSSSLVVEFAVAALIPVGWTACQDQAAPEASPASVAVSSSPSNLSLASDPRQMLDTTIQSAVLHRLQLDPGILVDRLGVQVLDGRVTLTGTVSGLPVRERALRDTARIAGVRRVVDLLKVFPTHRSDAAIGSALRAILETDAGTDGLAVVPRVRAGHVDLRGKVSSWQQAHLAGTVAADVRGVLDVRNELGVVYPRQFSDSHICTAIQDRLANDVRIDSGLVQVHADKGRVRLTGVVGSAIERDIAQTDSRVPGVTDVDAGALAVRLWNRRNMLDKSAATGNDLQTERAVSEALTYDPLLAGRMPRIGVDEGTVTLEGNVRSAQARHQAEQDALNVVGVTYVTNKLIVQPTRSVADSKLSRDVVRRLNNDPDLEASAIQVSVHSGVVRLSGFVPNRWERQLAERDIGAVVGVRQIEDVLVPRETRIRPADDSALRREVLLELGMNPYLDPEAISVSVANGVVTLTGAVLHTQAYNEAIAAARQAGARRVVAKLSLDNGLPAVSVMPPSVRGQTSSLGTNPHAEGTVLGSVEQATEQSEAATP